MRILIIGKGFVGDAIGFALSKEHTIFYHDPMKDENYDIRQLDDLAGVVLCLPTPADNDGNCDDTLVAQYYEKIRKKRKDLHILIKSTTSISTLAALQSKQDKFLTFSPEFLVADRARQDMVNAKFFIYSSSGLNGAKHWADAFENCTKYGRTEAYYCDSMIEAGFVKYAINSFLAMKVTFFNELKELFDTTTFNMGNFDNVTNLMALDSRIGESHMQVPGPDGLYGWGGACFPKDTSEFYNMSIAQMKPLHLLGTAIQLNTEHRSKDAKNSTDGE